jgi:hypothetical protein
MEKPNEIIDFVKRGNQVRFYLGKNGEQWGDDWDDAPFEYNAGKVYSKFIEGNKVIAFEFDDLVVDPTYGMPNSVYSKNDMINRSVPCIVAIRESRRNRYGYDTFEDVIADKESIKIYFGDDIDEVVMLLEKCR